MRQHGRTAEIIKKREAEAAAAASSVEGQDEPIDYAQIVDDFLNSSKGDHISRKIKNKIYNFAKVFKIILAVLLRS